MKQFTLSCLLLLTVWHIQSQNWQSLTYNPNQPGLELNPIKGFATLFNGSNNFPTSLQGKLFGLDEVMMGIDSFNWDVIDNFLAQETAKGNHAYIQVNIDPAFGNTHLPAYLFPLVDTFYYDDPNPNVVDDLCPDWNDPDLIEAMLNFIDHFSNKYDNDPRIFMIHLGLYGMWGEWHIGDVENVRPEFAMTEANKELIAQAYIDNFKTTRLVARYPENMPDAQAFGYSDGLFFGLSLSSNNPFGFHTNLRLYESDKNWLNHPIGGEIDPGLQSTIWDNWPNTVGQDVEECMDSIRPTWLFAHHNFTAMQPNTPAWDNAILAQKLMGYTLVVDSFRLSVANAKPTIELSMQNVGLAPIYANWPIAYAAINSDGTWHDLGEKPQQLDIILPDIGSQYRSFESSTSLVDDTYTILMKVVNPLESLSTMADPLRFANASQDQDSIGWLTLGDVTIAGGSAGTGPVSVTNISITPTVDTVVSGSTIAFSSTVTPSNATNGDVVWVSSHPYTCRVNQQGQAMTGIPSTTATIRAYSQDGLLMDSSLITVTPQMVPIPAVIEGEDYIDMFGIFTQTPSAGNRTIEYIDTKDWVEYGVSVVTAGVFTVDIDVATQNNGPVIAIVNEDDVILDTLHMPNIMSWNNYITISSKPLWLEAGDHFIKLVAYNGGYNMDRLEFKAGPPAELAYTFEGFVDDQYEIGANWIQGSPPPNGYNGVININADCVYKPEPSLLLGAGSTFNIAAGVSFTKQ